MCANEIEISDLDTGLVDNEAQDTRRNRGNKRKHLGGH
jgi:hypothetical protein